MRQTTQKAKGKVRGWFGKLWNGIKKMIGKSKFRIREAMGGGEEGGGGSEGGGSGGGGSGGGSGGINFPFFIIIINTIATMRMWNSFISQLNKDQKDPKDFSPIQFNER